MPARSAGWGGLFKVRAKLAPHRSAERTLLIGTIVFEQTAPPSLREATPPSLGGEWLSSNPRLHTLPQLRKAALSNFKMYGDCELPRCRCQHRLRAKLETCHA